ncbi:MAG: RNA polymerase sigma factor [Myxococcaceae bacterium]|nr:RNA polymerase sigma factor [Myxococcaceae bacterium]
MAPSASKSPDARPSLQLVRSDGPSDEELLRGVAAHDSSWADAFVRRVWPAVVTTVRRLMGDDADADDISQLAVMEALGSIKRYRRKGTLDGWVRTLTAHTVYKALRRKGLERRLFTALEVAEAESSRLPGPAAALRVRDAVKRVVRHLESVDVDRATAWALHDVHGFGLKEIAEITHVTEAAAQTRLSRGRRELLDLLNGDSDLAELLSELEETPS